MCDAQSRLKEVVKDTGQEALSASAVIGMVSETIACPTGCAYQGHLKI
jgi:hypothetical protein